MSFDSTNDSEPQPEETPLNGESIGYVRREGGHYVLDAPSARKLPFKRRILRDRLVTYRLVNPAGV